MPLSPHLRDRILRHLDTLSDEKGYAVLDYIEFVASRYGAKETASASTLFSRFTDGIEDTMRAGKLSASAISQTMGLLNQAVGVLGGVAAAGKSVANDLVSTASDVARSVSTPPPTGPAKPESPVAHQPPVQGTEPVPPAGPTADVGENPSPS